MTTGGDFSDFLPTSEAAPVRLREAELDPDLLREFAEACVDRARNDGVQLTR